MVVVNVVMVVMVVMVVIVVIVVVVDITTGYWLRSSNYFLPSIF